MWIFLANQLCLACNDFNLLFILLVWKCFRCILNFLFILLVFWWYWFWGSLLNLVLWKILVWLVFGVVTLHNLFSSAIWYCQFFLLVLEIFMFSLLFWGYILSFVCFYTLLSIVSYFYFRKLTWFENVDSQISWYLTWIWVFVVDTRHC